MNWRLWASPGGACQVRLRDICTNDMNREVSTKPCWSRHLGPLCKYECLHTKTHIFQDQNSRRPTHRLAPRRAATTLHLFISFAHAFLVVTDTWAQHENLSDLECWACAEGFLRCITPESTASHGCCCKLELVLTASVALDYEGLCG